MQLHQPASHIGLASSTNRSNSCLAEWMCPQKSTVLDLLSENTQLCHLCPTQCHSMVRKSTTASNREQCSFGHHTTWAWSIVDLLITEISEILLPCKGCVKCNFVPSKLTHLILIGCRFSILMVCLGIAAPLGSFPEAPRGSGDPARSPLFQCIWMLPR